MEKCIDKNVERFLEKIDCVTEKSRPPEKIYSRLFYCLDTLYNCGWLSRKAMRKIKKQMLKVKVEETE